MIDIDKYKGLEDDDVWQIAKDLLAEVKRLRETIKAYLDLDMESLEFCRIMREMGVIE